MYQIHEYTVQVQGEGEGPPTGGAGAAAYAAIKAADKIGASLGDTVAVSTSSGAVRRLKVIGLFHTGVTQADDATGYTVLKTAQVLFSRPNAINRLSIRLDDVNSARAVAQRVERALAILAGDPTQLG